MIISAGPCVVEVVPLSIVELTVQPGLVEVAYKLICIWDVGDLLLYS